MFGSAILEMTIGLILIFLLFSLIMTAAREALEGILKTRANNLQKALTELLGPPGDQMSDDKSATDKALQAFHEHPLIYALYKGNKIKGGLLTNAPSYIPSVSFATAVLDLVKAGEKLPKDCAAAKAYEVFSNQSGETADKIKVELVAWYDSAMDRAAGWYRRYTQWLLLVGGLIFALALNLNAVVIARHLSVDQTVRASIMRIAEQVSVEGVDSTEAEVRRLDNAVRTTGLPIGWGEDALRSFPKPSFTFNGAISLLETFLGYLAFAFAATLGAPFWFDLLGKFIAVRSTVKPKPTQIVAGS